MLVTFLAIVIAFAVLQFIRRNTKSAHINGSLRSGFPNSVIALRDLLGEEIWLGSDNGRSISYTGKVLSHGKEVGNMQYVLVTSKGKAPAYMFQVFQPGSANEVATRPQPLPASSELSIEDYKAILRRFSQEVSDNPIYQKLVIENLV